MTSGTGPGTTTEPRPALTPPAYPSVVRPPPAPAPGEGRRGARAGAVRRRARRRAGPPRVRCRRSGPLPPSRRRTRGAGLTATLHSHEQPRVTGRQKGGLGEGADALAGLGPRGVSGDIVDQAQHAAVAARVAGRDQQHGRVAPQRGQLGAQQPAHRGRVGQVDLRRVGAVGGPGGRWGRRGDGVGGQVGAAVLPPRGRHAATVAAAAGGRRSRSPGCGRGPALSPGPPGAREGAGLSCRRPCPRPAAGTGR